MLSFTRGGTPDPRIPPALLSPRRDTSRAWGSLFVRPGQRLIFRFSADILSLFETSSNDDDDDDDDDLQLFFITHRDYSRLPSEWLKPIKAISIMALNTIPANHHINCFFLRSLCSRR
jgi:hypothetical protein